MTAPTQQVTGLSGHAIWGRLPITNVPILRPPEQQRIMLLGYPGSGKTTWLLSVPRCLLIDSEKGAEELPTVHQSSYRMTINTWEDWEKVLQALKDDAQNGPRRAFDLVAFDTFDSFAGNQKSIAAEYVLRDTKLDVMAAWANGAGWSRLTELACRALLELEASGYGWAASVHVRSKMVKPDNGPITTELEADLTAGIERFVSNRAAYKGVLQRTVEQVPVRRTVSVQGKNITTDTGQYETVNKFWLKFTSATTGIERLCKARLLSGTEYAFGPSDGWSQFCSRYNAARAEIAARLSASVGGQTASDTSETAAPVAA